MKTTKTILSIALVALATTSFGQLSSLKEKLFSSNREVTYHNVNYKTENSRIESFTDSFRSKTNNLVYSDTYQAPVVSKLIFTERVDVAYEESLHLESWMTVPFENGLAETELSIESWMISPFSGSLLDSDESVEPWMTTPFDNSESIDIEPWMTEVWI